MKINHKLVIMALLCIILFKPSYGQSSWVEKKYDNVSTTITYGFTASYFYNSNLGWAVNYIGQLLKTTDGGETWTITSSNLTNWVRSIYFTSPEVGYAVGGKGLVYKTTDGGSNWLRYNYNIVQDLETTLHKIIFTSENVGYIVGQLNSILKTTDAGATWKKITFQDRSFMRLHDIEFSTPTEGWAVGLIKRIGVEGSNGAILHTKDAGETWSVKKEFNSDSYELHSVDFINDKVGYVCTYNCEVFKTIDGGENWISIYKNRGVPAPLTSAMEFINENEGWLAGNNGFIQSTTDGGITWKLESLGIPDAFVRINLISNKLAWIFSHSTNKIFKYSCYDIPKIVSTAASEACEGTESNYEAKSDFGKINWYNSASGGNILFTGDNYKPLLSDAQSFWAEAESKCGISSRSKVDGTITKLNNKVIFSNNTLKALESEASYQWLNCADNKPLVDANEQSYIPSSKGIYAAEITKNGCTVKSDCINITITGYDDDFSQEISISPNPAINILNINGFEVKKIPFKLTNSLGDKHMEGMILDGNAQIDISNLSPGIYFLNIKANRDKIYKIVKE